MRIPSRSQHFLKMLRILDNLVMEKCLWLCGGDHVLPATLLLFGAEHYLMLSMPLMTSFSLNFGNIF